MLSPRLFFLIFSFCAIHSLVQAQKTEDMKAIRKKTCAVAYETALRTKSLSHYEALFSDTLLAAPEWQATLYAGQGAAWRKINRTKFKDMDARNGVSDQDALRVLDYYDKAIATCPFCAPKAHRRRYEFLERLHAPESMYQESFQVIKAAVYKKKKSGVGLGLYGMAGGQTYWLGVEAALISNLQPTYRLRSFDSAKNQTRTIERRSSVATQALILGYARQLDGDYNEFSISLLRLTAPFMLNIAQIGWYATPNESELNGRLFYRPEIGIGRNRFSLSYGYNWVFRTNARRLSPSHLVYLRLVSPFD